MDPSDHGDILTRDDLAFFLDNYSVDESGTAEQAPFSYPEQASKRTLDHPINLQRHLFCLCIDYMIPFINWARGPALSFIKTTLLDNDYTRCEVRNGVVIVIVYTFAATQAKYIPGSDMFLTLQDPENGLGIANKFSLKIYNDPFYFLSFLKTSVSCLITAGAIPDNERLNQRRRTQDIFENKSEQDAFNSLKKLLIQTVEMKNLALAQNCVKQVTLMWDNKAKRISHMKLTEALNIVRSILMPSATEEEVASTSNDTLENASGHLTKRKRTDQDPELRPIQTLVFTRHSTAQWKFKLFSVFNFKRLLDDLQDSTIEIALLLDEQRFYDYVAKSSDASSFLTSRTTESLFSMGETYYLNCSTTKPVSRLQNPLLSELTSASSTITHWNKGEFGQLSAYLSAWQEFSRISLCSYWQQCAVGTIPSSPPGTKICGGILAIEVVQLIGFVIRPCADLGLQDEAWGLYFPGDLERYLTDADSMRFGTFLCQLFPQLQASLLRNANFTEQNMIVVVTHLAHHNTSASRALVPLQVPGSGESRQSGMWDSPPVAPSQNGRYRTIGNITDSTSEILSSWFDVSNTDTDISNLPTKHSSISFGFGDHSLELDETEGFVNYLNQIFEGEPVLARHLPLQIGADDLFEKFSDGLIFYKLIQLASPEITVSFNFAEPLNIFQKLQNLNAILRAAASIGCVIVNIGPQDIVDAKRISILGLLWQLMRIQLLSKVHVSFCPSLAVLMKPYENAHEFRELSPEEILIRWFNYHLGKRNMPFVSSFGNPWLFGELLLALGVDIDLGVDFAMYQKYSPNEVREVARGIIECARKIGVCTFVTSSTLLCSPRMRLAFAAQIFSVNHGLPLLNSTAISSRPTQSSLCEPSDGVEMILSSPPPPSKLEKLLTERNEVDFIFLSNRKLPVQLASRLSDSIYNDDIHSSSDSKSPGFGSCITGKSSKSLSDVDGAHSWLHRELGSCSPNQSICSENICISPTTMIADTNSMIFMSCTLEEDPTTPRHESATQVTVAVPSTRLRNYSHTEGDDVKIDGSNADKMSSVKKPKYLGELNWYTMFAYVLLSVTKFAVALPKRIVYFVFRIGMQVSTSIWSGCISKAVSIIGWFISLIRWWFHIVGTIFYNSTFFLLSTIVKVLLGGEIVVPSRRK